MTETTLPIHVQEKRFAEELKLVAPLKEFICELPDAVRTTPFYASVEQYFVYVERCADLEEKFRVVTLDTSATRTIEKGWGNDRKEFQVPLMFIAVLRAEPTPSVSCRY